jgi:hypothetical protein
MGMAGSCWRLLAAFLVILVTALLRGQDNPANQALFQPPNSEMRYGTTDGGRILSAPNPVGRPHPIGNLPVGRYPVVPGPVGFGQIAQPAGIIFSGTVTAVEHPSPRKRTSSAAITFKVERAIRGASAGKSLTIHEWAGLWNRGERYRVGERVFLFLYAPSRLGLTSPIGGGVGRFVLDSAGRVLLTPQHVRLFEADPILAGKTIVSYADFLHAMQRSGFEQ